MDILRQFYDKRFGYVLLVILGAHILAALLQHTWFSVIPLAGAFIAAFALTYKRIDWGMAFAFLEIFIGGHGHLFSLSTLGLPVSLRIVIFAGVMLAWFVRVLQKRVDITFISRRDTPWILFGLALIVGAVNGFMNNDFGNAFDDFNSYLAALYFLPMISMVWRQEEKRLLLLTLSVSALWVALSTLVLLFAFTHLPGMWLRELYTFVRDARLAEVTILTPPESLSPLFFSGEWYFRVFEQSQFIVLAFMFVFLASMFMLYRSKEDRLPWQVWKVLVIIFAVILASMSRSFWLGAIMGGAVLFGSFILDRVPLTVLLKRTVASAFMGIVAMIALWAIVVVPLPPRPDFTESPFYRGDDGGDRNLAVSSRWNLLPPMMEEIAASPVIGSGFGEEVTFVSDDPRVREQNPTGEWTTYRFEWGYQDLWLKTGVFGLAAIFWYLLGLINATVLRLRLGDEARWLSVGFEAAILSLFVVHVFSPYINHPIGLGFMIFVLPFFPWRDERYEREELHVLQGARDALQSVTKPQVGIVTR